MLQSIRDRTQGWFAGTIISLLILSFALWGIHSYFIGGANSDVIAKVNGVEISKNQLALQYQRLRHQLQMQSNSNSLPANVEDNLRQHALQALVNLQILKQASLAQNYRVSSDQIDNFLQNMPEFQVNGKFSIMRFEQALSATFFSVQDFMDLLRTTLLIDQPRLGIVFTSFALPNEIKDTMGLIGQERKIQYAIISTQNLSNKGIAVTSNDINAYYTQHKDEFKTNEQVSVDYLMLSTKELAAEMNPTEEQLKTFYNDNKNSTAATYDKDKVKAAYLRQKSEEKFADAREKLASLTYEHPDTLQTAAKELGLQIHTSGLFTKEQGGKDISSDSNVRNVAFSNDILNLQNNSDVIQLSPDSVVVIRLKSHIPAKILSLETVQKQIEDKLKAAAIEEKLAQLASELQAKLQSGSLTQAEISNQYHIQWIDAGFISRHAKNIDASILNNAFEMPIPAKENKMVYGTAKMTNGFAIIGLSAVKESNTTTVSKAQYQAFADQIQNSEGVLEYNLYKDSLIRQSKIVIN